jgi:glycerol-3-phosphate acyltransferase PlsY
MLWANVVADNLAGWKVSLAIILASYLLGCATAGYYLVRWHRGSDIRSGGSGSAGATNVSRELGATGFAVTMALDMAKGALASWLAIRYHLGPVAQLLAMLAAILGHIWPVQLRFRGGKGVATLGGVVLVADYRVFLLVLGLFLVPFVFLRRFTLSGLTALALAPVVLAFGFSLPSRALGLLILLLPIFWAHRENIREDLRSMFAGAENRSSGGISSRKE